MSTGINYLDEVWNPISGCQGKGCKCRETCWARDMVKRFPQIHGWDPDTEDGHVRGYSPLEFSKVQFHPDRLDKPLHWRKPRRIGVCFMGDWMDEQVPEKWISDIYVVMMECERIGLKHQFFTLTKQSGRLSEMIRPCVPLGNLWNGISITDQEDADRMIPDLLRIPGKRWISYEPAIFPVDFPLFIGYYPINENKGDVADETNNQRENNLSTCRIRGIGDRHSGEDLEAQEKNWEENRWNPFDAMQEGKSGAALGKLPSGSCNDKLDEISHSGSQAGIPPFSRTHPKGINDQSQKREETRQLAGQSGTGDIFRPDEPYDSCSQERSGVEPRWRKKPHGETNGKRCQRNSGKKKDRGTIEINSKGLQDNISTRFGNSTYENKGIQFIVMGCESGPKRRHININAFRSVRYQAWAAGVKLWVKQMDIGGKVTGDVNLFPEDLQVRQLP